jgi:hypothetical protein
VLWTWIPGQSIPDGLSPKGSICGILTGANIGVIFPSLARLMACVDREAGSHNHILGLCGQVGGCPLTSTRTMESGARGELLVPLGIPIATW